MMSRLAATAAVSVAVASLSFVAACSTPPDFFHTLRPTALDAAPASHAGSRPLAIGPVTVPDSLARNEWVVRVGDTGVQVYDHQLWTQGLAADVAQSLTDYLNRGTLPNGLWADAGPTGSGSGADLVVPPVLRVQLQVLRFDSVLAPAVAISDQMRWTIECLPSDTTLSPVEAGRYHRVRTAVRDIANAAPAADGAVDPTQQRYDRLARAHSAALHLIADDIAAALRDSAAERAHDCVPIPR